MILTPLFLLSAILAYVLYRELEKEEKQKRKQGEQRTYFPASIDHIVFG